MRPRQLRRRRGRRMGRIVGQRPIVAPPVLLLLLLLFVLSFASSAAWEQTTPTTKIRGGGSRGRRPPRRRRRTWRLVPAADRGGDRDRVDDREEDLEIEDRDFWAGRLLRNGGGASSFGGSYPPAVGEGGGGGGGEEGVGPEEGGEEKDEEGCAVPSSFLQDGGGVLVRVVSLMSSSEEGDFFGGLERGAKLQALKFAASSPPPPPSSSSGGGGSSSSSDNATTVVTPPSPSPPMPQVLPVNYRAADANGDANVMAELVDAVGGGAVATILITVSGSAEALCDPIAEALKKGVTVVSFDLDTSGNDGAAGCGPGHLLVSQSDAAMADLVLREAAEQFSGSDDDAKVKVGYVSDLGFRPLANRDEVWEEYKARYGWDEVFAINDAVTSYETQEQLCDAIAERLRSNDDDVDFIYAPYNYLAEAALCGISQPESAAYVYGADVSDRDVQLMTVPPYQSPWKATAGGVAEMVGAAVMRTALVHHSRLLDGESGAISATIPSFLFTQDFMLEEGVTDLQSLCSAAAPERDLELREFDPAQACWLPSLTCAEAFART